MDSTANAAVQIGQYRLLTTLGIGAFGKVKRELLSQICSPNQHTVGSCLFIAGLYRHQRMYSSFIYIRASEHGLLVALPQLHVHMHFR
jgi:hypothetical protein